MLDCSPGQRWISSTEPELGLGIVFEVVDRRVVMSFPAGEERRTYALDNAPLTRVKYRVADRVRAEDGRELIVSERVEVEGCIVYRGINAHGSAGELHEIDLDSYVQFNRPLDRLFTGQIDKNQRFSLRALTLDNHHQHQVSSVFGLLGPRVQLLPHQFFIANEVSARHAPRVLLADEVGLGKTIEAGLILHRQLLSGQASRVLILVPDNLIHQWLVEMLRRFNLHFSILDADTCDALVASGEHNPFESAQLALVPLSLLAGDERRRDQVLAARWDLLVVDEAHHLAWSPDESSAEYAAVEALAGQVSSLLLLTATPEQLGISGHFARLALLDPHRYHSLEEYLEEEQRYGAVSSLVSALLAEDAAGTVNAALLTEAGRYLGHERIAALRSGSDDGLGGRLVRELLDHHGTGRVLFRNCREHIPGFPSRQLHTYPLHPGPAYLERLRELDPIDMLTPELAAEDDWISLDPRAEWLCEWLREHRGQRALVICALATTAQDLETWLSTRKGIRAAVFHEDMDLVQRDRAAAYFADDEDGADVLVCSEIGSEGRNFQFAHQLVLFDLPLNPDLLEQRIGRLDRIGQTHTVKIHVPYFVDSSQAVLLTWLHQGIDAFERISAVGPALFEEFARPLLLCMDEPAAAEPLEQLLDATAERAAQVAELLRQGRDRLLELNSFEPTGAARVISEVEATARIPELSAYMDEVFDAFGVEHEDDGPDCLVVQPGDHMSCEAFPSLPEGGLSVTFSRAVAQSRDEVHFLTWEHPMVTGAMDMVLGSEFGNACLAVVKSARLPPGSLLVECLFVIVCPAPRGLRVQRYLRKSMLRVVVDGTGEDVSETLQTDRLNTIARDVPPATATKVVQRMQDQIEQLVEHATHIGEVRQEGIVAEARSVLESQLGSEITRLRHLANVNPNVRAEEIAALEDQLVTARRFLDSAQLKLDAVRVIVTT